MGISPEAQQFAQFLERTRANASTPGLDLAIVRDIVETHHLASTEPEASPTPRWTPAVSPPCGASPRAPTPTRRCSTSTSAARSPPRCTRIARPPVTSRRRPESARSPWTDLTITNPAVDKNSEHDKMLSRNTLELFRGAWLQDPAVDFTDPAISLVNADLTGLPPTSVHYGEYETLAGDGADFGRRLPDFKVTSEVHPMPEGQHSFILAAGRVPEVDQAIQQMGQWLRTHLGT